MWYTAIPGFVKWGAIALMVLGAIGTGWGIVSGIKAGERHRLIAQQLGEALAAKERAQRERNALWARFQNLPEVRQRICATRDPSDGCCQPTGDCQP